MLDHSDHSDCTAFTGQHAPDHADHMQIRDLSVVEGAYHDIMNRDHLICPRDFADFL